MNKMVLFLSIFLFFQTMAFSYDSARDMNSLNKVSPRVVFEMSKKKSDSQKKTQSILKLQNQVVDKSKSILSKKYVQYTKNYLCNKLSDFEPKCEKHFVVLIPSYNNSKWYKKNLDSIFAQKYNNYHILYIDDCSPDGTGDLVEKYVKEKGQEHRFILIKNKEQHRAMANVCMGVWMCEDSDIIATCDGDDWWMGDNVLSLLNKIYQFDVWMTHGSVFNSPEEVIVQKNGYPKEIVEKNDFRDYGWLGGGLRSFYVWLFKKIKIEDFKIDGQFLSVSHDVAIMFPMFEMAGKRHMFIPDPLYVSNRATGINDCTLYAKAQRAVEQYIRYVKPRYEPLKGSTLENAVLIQNISIQDTHVSTTFEAIA